MMGRGAEGGSHQLVGSSSAPGSSARVDIYSQVLKEVAADDLSRESFEPHGEIVFPLSVVSYSLKGTGLFDSKRKNNRSKKTQPRSRDNSRPVGKQGHHADDPPAAAGDGTAGLFWAQMDDYFRDVTTSDVQLLLPATMFHLSENGTVSDPCLLIPPVGQHYTEKWAEEDLQQADIIASEQIGPRPKRKLPSSGSINKKSKRSGELTTIISPAPDGEELCHVCNSGDSDESNQILFCDICNVAVHQDCYGVRIVPEGQWLCSWCSWKAFKKVESVSTFECVLCPSKGGALKPVAEVDSNENTVGRTGTKFAHLFCSQWVPETFIGNMEVMEPIRNIEGVRDERWRLLCSICKEKHGACIQCSHGMCATAFHPLCAREAKFYMEVCSLEDSEDIEYRAYCTRHSAAHMGKASVTLNEGFDAGTSQSKPTTDVAEKPRDNGTLAGIEPLEPKAEVSRTEQTSLSSSVVRLHFVDDAHISAGQQPQIDSVTLDNGNQPDVVTPAHSAVVFEGGEGEGSKVSGHLNGQEPLQPIHREQQGFEEGLKSPSPQSREASESLHPESVDRVKQETSRSNVKSSDNIEEKSTSLPKSEEHELHRRSSDATSEGSRGQADGDASGEVATTVCDDKGSDERRQRGLSGEASTSHSQATTSPFDNPAVVPAQISNSPSSNKPLEKETVDPITGIEVSEEDLSQHRDELQKNISQAFAHPQIEQRLREYQPISATKGIDHPVEFQISSKSPVGAVEADASDSLEMQWEQLRAAEKEGVLKLAPDDEIEGEILVLQNSLLSRAEENRLHCEGLISKMIPRLPEERASSLKRMQELDFVHRYVSQKREVKKQGRKEKRHKEAQAVLAAATAAAAASPRVGYIKRDALSISDTDNQPLSPSQEITAFDYSSGIVPSSNRRLKPPVPRLSYISNTSPYPLVLSARSGYQARTGTEVAVLRTGYGQFLLEGEESACDVCNSRESSRGNKIVTCNSCKVNVHQECYGIGRVPQGVWLCQPCTELQRQSQSLRSPGVVAQANMLWAQCALCCRGAGALKRSTDGRWVHVFCAQWMPETSTGKDQASLIQGMESVNPERFALLCSVCQRQEGACLTCNFGHCHGAFHPPCARDSGLYMTVRISTGGRLQYRAYCDRHSTVQRAKDEQVEQRQRSGNEELHSLRQIRVEFERVRLMCERICRRERLKREVLQTTKDIVVAQLLSAAHVEMNNLEQLPEPASINRELPLASIQQMPTNIQHRNQMIVTNPPGDETKEHTRRHKKMKKHGRTRLHREQLMTPMEASVLNMRLPKGYAYVPVDVYVKGTIIPTQPDPAVEKEQQLPPTSLPP